MSKFVVRVTFGETDRPPIISTVVMSLLFHCNTIKLKTTIKQINIKLNTLESIKSYKTPIRYRDKKEVITAVQFSSLVSY